MTSLHRRSWSGSLDWRALEGFERFLARRVGDRGEWVVGVGENDERRGVSGGSGIGSNKWSADNEWSFGSDGQASTGLCGHISYGWGGATDQVASRHQLVEAFPLISWWVPRFLVVLRNGMAEVHAADHESAAAGAFLDDLLADRTVGTAVTQANWQRQTAKARYITQVEKALVSIQRGDVYEVNYCTERTATLERFDPYVAFARLLRHSDAPFAGFYKFDDRYVLCASPERYLRIEGNTGTGSATKVIAQPMKGTRPRDPDPIRDLALATQLANDAKERSENIMALDVARNDLSRVAASRSVQVEELCAVKSYPNVHQLVSTVGAGIREGLGPWDAIRATFPMASMTGAPKIRAMQLIDELEDMPRGLFSGTLGIFLPDGAADLNVVIRTITYDASSCRASLITGSAITALSEPEKEWEECELKARSVLNAFGHVG